jgi:hypothetical protein
MRIEGVGWMPRWPRLLLFHRVCPLCSSVEFKEDVPHLFDRLLRLFALQPTRCVNCWRRYYWFKWSS